MSDQSATDKPILRGGMNVTLYQCTHCRAVEQDDQAHVHHVDGAQTTVPKRRVELRVFSSMVMPTP